jgi:hypothetical protein
MNSFLLRQLSASYHCSILHFVSGFIRRASRSFVSVLIQNPPYLLQDTAESVDPVGFSQIKTPAALFSFRIDAVYRTPETARTAGRSWSHDGAGDAVALSCFSYRPSFLV